jgi:hypothetical protein
MTTKETIAAFKFISSVESEETDGLKEWSTTLVILHNGLDFDFSQTLTQKDSNGQRELLYSLEDQGKCLIID